METINDRMQQIADVFCGGNKAAFAKAIGIAPTSITNYIGKQRASKPSSDLLEKIVNSLEVDAMWLLTGKGKMKRQSIDLLEAEVANLKAEISRLETLKSRSGDRRLYDLLKQFMANQAQYHEIMKEMASIYGHINNENK